MLQGWSRWYQRFQAFGRTVHDGPNCNNNSWDYWKQQFSWNWNGMVFKWNLHYCFILVRSHCKTLQEKLHECSGESHAFFAWTTATTDPCIRLSVTFRHRPASAIFDPHICQYSTTCTDNLHIIPSTEGKKTSEVHYSENYKPENKCRSEH